MNDPIGMMQWALLATNWAMTRSHIDAGGLATAVEIVTGHKLWFVAEPKADPRIKYPAFKGLEPDNSAYSWQLCSLKPGDRL